MEPEKSKTAADQLSFNLLITETLFRVLRVDGGEWASPEQVDKVLDFINQMEEEKRTLMKSVTV